LFDKHSCGSPDINKMLGHDSPPEKLKVGVQSPRGGPPLGRGKNLLHNILLRLKTDFSRTLNLTHQGTAEPRKFTHELLYVPVQGISDKRQISRQPRRQPPGVLDIPAPPLINTIGSVDALCGGTTNPSLTAVKTAVIIPRILQAKTSSSRVRLTGEGDTGIHTYQRFGANHTIFRGSSPNTRLSTPREVILSPKE